MNNNPYFVVKEPNTFQDFLAVLKLVSEAPQNFTILYRGQDDKKWHLNSTLARPLAGISQPFRKIAAQEEMRLYFEKYKPSDELLKYEKEGIDPICTLGKHLQQNPRSKKIKNRPHDKKINTPFIDFTSNPWVALFFANYHLQPLSEYTFRSSLERKAEGAIFIVYVSSIWTRKNFEEIVDHIVLHLKDNLSAPPIFWNPTLNLNDLDDQKSKRQQAEYIFHSSLDLNIEMFACEQFIIHKILVKKDWFSDISEMLDLKGYTMNYLFPGYVLVDSD